MTLTEVRRRLSELDIRPSKALGQNFLVDSNILQIILREADIRADETVLEIGPGLGMVTEPLLDRAKQVVAIEKDARLCEYLRGNLPALELIEGDAVKVLDSRFKIPGSGFKVVSNLPYSISTPILERLVEGELKPRRMVVTLQREVARRLAATPRTKEYGALTVFTQLRYHVTIAHMVSPRCFYPSPRVESAVAVLDRRDPRVELKLGAPFREIVRMGFGQRRKMLKKLLAGFRGVERAFAATALSSTARAEELSLEQWISLANEIRASNDGFK